MVSILKTINHLAVVGMDIALVGCDGLAAFERMSYLAVGQDSGYQELSVSSASKAALLEKVTRRALLDAGLDVASFDKRVCVITAVSQAFQVNWLWASAVVDVSHETNPLIAALAQTGPLLDSKQFDLIVFSAAAGGQSLQAGAGFGFAREVHEWRLGDGAGAVVLMEAAKARQEDRRIYALVQGTASSPGKKAPANGVGLASRSCAGGCARLLPGGVANGGGYPGTGRLYRDLCQRRGCH